MAGYLERFESESASALVVDTGDLLFRKFRFFGPQRDAAAAQATLILDAYDLMGCRGVNIDINDLALGTEFLLEMQGRVHFPFLSANLVYEDNGKCVFTPYSIHETTQGVRIGLFGLITANRTETLPDLGVEVIPPAEAAAKIVEELKAKACDLVVALSQLERQENEELAQKVAGIHYVLSGNRRGFPLLKTSGEPAKLGETIFVQAHNLGRHLGRLDVTVIDHGYRFVSYSQKPHIIKEIDLLGEQLRQFSQELTACAADLQTTQGIVAKLDGVKKDVQALQGCSYYESAQIPLNKTVEGRQDIETMVGRFKDGAEQLKKNLLEDGQKGPSQKDKDVIVIHDENDGDDDEEDEDDEEDDEDEEDNDTGAP